MGSAGGPRAAPEQEVGRGGQRGPISRGPSRAAWEAARVPLTGVLTACRGRAHFSLGLTWVALPSPEPWGPAAAPSSRKPSCIPGSISGREASCPASCRPAWLTPCRNEAGRGPRNLLPVRAQGQGHQTLSALWGRGCLQRTRKTRKLTANCTWPKTETPKLRYRRPPTVGPQGAGQRLHGGTEAQHGPCGAGVRVRPGWVPQRHRAGRPLPGCARGLPCPPAPPPGPAGLVPVDHSAMKGPTGHSRPAPEGPGTEGPGPGAITGQAPRELADRHWGAGPGDCR